MSAVGSCGLRDVPAIVDQQACRAALGYMGSPPRKFEKHTTCGNTLQSAGVSSAMVTVLEGLVVIFVVGSSQWAQRSRRQMTEPPRRAEEPAAVPMLEQESSS